MVTAHAEEVEHSRKVLLKLLSPGSEIGTVVIQGRGMTDWVECFVASADSPPRVIRVTYYVARVIGDKLTDKGIARRGGQYDKAHDVVDGLSRALFGEGNKLTRNRLLG